MVYFCGCFNLLSIAVKHQDQEHLGRKGFISLRTPSLREVGAGTQGEPIGQETPPQT